MDVSARILAVDDVSHNLELMTYLLQASGHEVIAAATGADAVRLASEHRPDLIVLDVQLPDIDGYEVLRRLRAEPELEQLPIIAVTAYAMVGDRDHALAAGFDGYLAKPIDPTTLIEALNAYLPDDRRGHEPHLGTAEEARAWQPS
jgi:CheY-like chemotaxis protein